MRAFAACLCLVAVSGCMGAGVEEQVREETLRAVARTAVNGAVAQHLPGVDAAPYTECVIANATADELLALGRAGGTAMLGNAASATTQVWPVVRTVSARPATVQCLAGVLSPAQILSAGRGLL